MWGLGRNFAIACWNSPGEKMLGGELLLSDLLLGAGEKGNFNLLSWH